MSGSQRGEAVPQPELSLVPWICSSDFTFPLPPLRGNQPRGLRRSRTTKAPSATAQLDVRGFPA